MPNHRKSVRSKQTMAKKMGNEKLLKPKDKKIGKLKKQIKTKRWKLTKKYGRFIPFKDIKNDKCTICQEDLQSSDIIKRKVLYMNLHVVDFIIIV